MALTQRAEAWLATLYRENALPLAEIERLIRAAGGTPHAIWLDFHDRYGGYVEEVGPNDFAVWGLARSGTAEPPNWCNQPDNVFIRPSDGDFPEAIACAEAHPVHDYMLYADGWFMGIGGPCPTFDMKIERHGLVHEMYARGKVRRTDLYDSNDPECQQLLHSVSQLIVPEASSDDMKFYSAPDRLVRFAPGAKQVVLYESVP